MIDRLIATSCSLQKNAQVLLDFLLPNIFSQAPGAQTALDGLLFVAQLWRDKSIAHDVLLLFETSVL